MALAAAVGLSFLVTGPASAALCVWRDPSGDIKEFFGGGTYRTVFMKVGAKRAAIERAVGAPLDPDENELKFWPIIKNGKRVGTVVSHLGKGNYGAIEVIIAVTEGADGLPKVKAIKIQREREKRRAELRSPTFLNQFLGKTPCPCTARAPRSRSQGSSR